MRFLIVVCFLSLVVPNASIASISEFRLGSYNGKGIVVSVGDQIISVEMSCANGQFPRPSVHADGSFKAIGWLESELVMPDVHPVSTVFSGLINGDKIQFWVEEDGKKSSAYLLEKGDPQFLQKCQ